MAHRRIRPFNTKQTYPEQNLDNDLAQGVVARGTMVFLRGQLSQDLDSRNPACWRCRSANRKSHAEYLAAAKVGSALIITRIVVYLTDIRYREAVYQEMGKG